MHQRFAVRTKGERENSHGCCFFSYLKKKRQMMWILLCNCRKESLSFEIPVVLISPLCHAWLYSSSYLRSSVCLIFLVFSIFVLPGITRDFLITPRFFFMFIRRMCHLTTELLTNSSASQFSSVLEPWISPVFEALTHHGDFQQRTNIYRGNFLYFPFYFQYKFTNY